MAKGFFSQGMCLLTDGQTTLEDIKTSLREEKLDIVVKQMPPDEDWRFGGPKLVIPYLPKVNGYASIDVVTQSWPDAMGDPKTDSMTFGAWSMGFFGPFAFPGGLARAGQHSWVWQPGRAIAEGHRGFIRILLSYVSGTEENAPILPKDYDPLAEMYFLSRLVLALLEAPGVICYFNPNGEVLRDRASFREVWAEGQKQKKIPLPLWMNIRFFRINEEFGMMDTVGNPQLDLQDLEALFPWSKYEPGDIAYYLRNVTHYLLGLDRELQTGEEIDGPGESNLSWITEGLEEGTIKPPRGTLRLYPKVNRKEIREALEALGSSPA